MNQAQIKLVESFALVTDNVSREVATYRELFESNKEIIELVQSFVVSGYDGSQPPVGYYEPTKDVAKKALEIKKSFPDYIGDWKDKDGNEFAIQLSLPDASESGSSHWQITASEIADSIRQFYGKKGEVTTPKHMFAYGFRRFVAMHIANAFRRKMDLPLIEVVNAFGPYNDEETREIACVHENTMKVVGIKRLTPTDLVKSAYTLFQRGKKQADLRRTFKDGTGQKLWEYCRMAAMHPSLKLIQRARQGEIDVGAFKPSDLKKVNDGGWSDEDVEAFVKNPKGTNESEKKNAKKMMSKSDIETLQRTTEVEVIRDVVSAIISNQSSFLQALAKHRDLINDVYKAIKSGETDRIKVDRSGWANAESTTSKGKTAKAVSRKPVAKPGK